MATLDHSSSFESSGTLTQPRRSANPVKKISCQAKGLKNHIG